MRSLVVPALENIPTWHERDLTQSSVERFTIPEAFILIDYMLVLMDNIITQLRVDELRMQENLKLTRGRAMSESVMLALVKKGMNRQEAHELLRTLNTKSEVEKKTFRRILVEDNTVHKKMREKQEG
jgi:adenylosuccinate lyase